MPVPAYPVVDASSLLLASQACASIAVVRRRRNAHWLKFGAKETWVVAEAPQQLPLGSGHSPPFSGRSMPSVHQPRNPSYP